MKPPDKTTEELIREIKQELNVDENFRQLFERNYGQIHRFFQRKGFSPEDSRELTQVTFISVYKGLEGFRQEAPFINWLFSIARNIWISELRRIKHEVTVVPIEQDAPNHSDRPEQTVAHPVDPAPGPEDHMIEKEMRQMLYGEMRQLPKQMRRCVEFRIIHGRSYEEIAKLMGISSGAVKAQLHQAKKRLGERLRPYFGEIEL